MAGYSSDETRQLAAAAAIHRAVGAFFPQAAEQVRIEQLPGGFSGSPVARVVLSEGETWVLKALPPSLGVARGRWLHELMQHLRGGGIVCVPQVASLPDAAGSLFADRDAADGAGHDGQLWEAVHWMPGRPQREPSAVHAAAAMQLLARTHARAASFPASPAVIDAVPALTERTQQAARLLRTPWRRLLEHRGNMTARLSSQLPGGAARRIDRAFSAAAKTLAFAGEPGLTHLAHLPALRCPLIAVMRDLTADHLLFRDRVPVRLPQAGGPCGRESLSDEPTSPEVSGLLDFHAARLDSPACDLARLLASWHGGVPPRERTEEAVHEYVAAWDALGGGGSLPSPDPTQLVALVELLAATGVVLGLDNWFRWLLEEDRWFPDWDAVAERLEQHQTGLEEALGCLATSPATGLAQGRR